MQYRTPLLARIPETFEEYLKSLSKSARHNYKATQEKNKDKKYIQIQYYEPIVSYFMKLWEAQEVEGKHPRWIFGPDYFQYQAAQGVLRLFVVYHNGDIIGLHPTEKHGQYLYSHPPCYDKKRHPELAGFMWFSLMEWACGKVHYVDLGGGCNGTWRDAAMKRLNGSFTYKWRYVPKESKQHPEEEPPYIQMRCACGGKQLILNHSPCQFCGNW